MFCKTLDMQYYTLLYTYYSHSLYPNDSTFYIALYNISLYNTGVCALSLTHFEINGCSKVMDPGLSSIAQFVNLTHLGIRGCDHGTDTALINIAQNCILLHTLDMINLDYISVVVVTEFVKHCVYLHTFCCEGCSFTAKEFTSAVKANKLPFATPVGTKCKLKALPRAVICHNLYAMEVQKHEMYVRKLQKFGHFIIGTYLMRVARQ